MSIHQALKQAQKAAEEDEVPVGAVITFNGRIIAHSHNLVRQTFDPTAHAEILAIRQATQSLKTSILDDCELYVTLEPCAMCAAAISHARIKKLFFGAYDVKFGAVEHGARVFNFMPHKPQIIGGIEEQKCGQILKDFFLTKRHK